MRGSSFGSCPIGNRRKEGAREIPHPFSLFASLPEKSYLPNRQACCASSWLGKQDQLQIHLMLIFIFLYLLSLFPLIPIPWVVLWSLPLALPSREPSWECRAPSCHSWILYWVALLDLLFQLCPCYLSRFWLLLLVFLLVFIPSSSLDIMFLKGRPEKYWISYRLKHSRLLN